VSGPSAWNNAASLATRVVVAGGAGGGGNDKVGGVGGGLVAGEGASNSCTGGDGLYCSGLGGSQTYGNALGVGGNGAGSHSGGGGGGYWGGWGSGQSPQLIAPQRVVTPAAVADPVSLLHKYLHLMLERFRCHAHQWVQQSCWCFTLVGANSCVSNRCGSNWLEWL
jgi:hypothetical protein